MQQRLRAVEDELEETKRSRQDDLEIIERALVVAHTNHETVRFCSRHTSLFATYLVFRCGYGLFRTATAHFLLVLGNKCLNASCHVSCVIASDWNAT